MKLDSKYFDMIRIRPQRAEAAEPVPPDLPCCQWSGCTQPAPHRAPKGRGRDGQYFAFCADHVRRYNASYNYFSGMSDAEVEQFQKDAMTGHRPTWKTGANAWGHGTASGGSEKQAREFHEAKQATKQRYHAWRAEQARSASASLGRKFKPLEKKALTAMGLGDGASKDDIKARFKELVKRHHPDANGGDRGAEEKLREIIQAYNYLKQVGLV